MAEFLKSKSPIPEMSPTLLVNKSNLLFHDETLGACDYNTLSALRDNDELDALIEQVKRVQKLAESTTYIPMAQGAFPRVAGIAKELLKALEFHLQQPSVYFGRTLNQLIQWFNWLADCLFAVEPIDPSSVLAGTEPLRTEILNLFLADFRAAVRIPQHRKALAKFERASVKNTRSAQRYVVRLFERYSRLLVVRVDLSYGEHAKRTVTAQQACDDRERLFRNAKANRLFQHLVGYVWKLELGKERRYHYHMFFFFDGAKVRQDVTLARHIGEYWKQHITGGRGCYFNCNAHKERYTELGIGMVSWNDSRMQQGLLRGVRYLTKADEWIRLALPENGRSFGKGELPSLSDTPRGRPRQLINSNLTF
ncbi:MULTISPECIES: inovirus-type Gp2 protein [unclassified Serratia (in: enterobacteria)]|uniref:YagK/YfjJ domain-containing protein n=1 Tax=unclassified Serratia (in: enterobacteria) TaxID=2647522 RepID=UPI0004685A61|nr:MULTISPECIES: inovirus-type Gp2 protein [unclassified Serratia (in: enterobacteria)]